MAETAVGSSVAVRAVDLAAPVAATSAAAAAMADVVETAAAIADGRLTARWRLGRFFRRDDAVVIHVDLLKIGHATLGP